MARILVLDDDPAIARLYALWPGSTHEITVMTVASEVLSRSEEGEGQVMKGSWSVTTSSSGHRTCR